MDEIQLVLLILREPFISSDTKALIFISMINNLEQKGYSEEQIRKVKESTQKIMNTFMTKNEFMG
jgi:DNA-directed RNA polymerase specialized sigma54-like protein